MLQCGDMIRTAHVCRSVADATIQIANREPLPIPMPNTITPTETECQVIHRVTFPAIYPEHNAQEYSRKAGDEPQRIQRPQIMPRFGACVTPPSCACG